MVLEVGQMFYPEIFALRDPKIIELYNSQGIKRPRPALGINTPLLTADERLTLTVRGIRPNQYPRRLYAPGGQPETAKTDPFSHQLEEIADEVLIRPDEINQDSMVFDGLVVDLEDMPGKPDLVGIVQVSLDAGDIKERVLGREFSKRPNDVIGVVFAPSKQYELMDYLTQLMHPQMFCPPSFAGLALYGRQRFGVDWYQDLEKRLNHP